MKDDAPSVPGARIFTPEVVFEIDEGDKTVLLFELLSIDRPDAPFDAKAAADLLQKPGEVKFDDRQAYAVVRALDNLRDGNRLDGRHELRTVGEALRRRLQLPLVSVSYELDLPGEPGLTPWESYSGRRESGELLLTGNGSQWRIVAVEKRPGDVDLLKCEPWIDPEAE